MGYTTDFNGEWTITPPLDPPQIAYLKAFADRRHVRRNEKLLADRPDPLRVAVGLPLGRDGQFYVGETSDIDWKDPSVVDQNNPPGTSKYGAVVGDGSDSVPELYCQWLVSDDGTYIAWDGGEKFYEYIDWIGYLIDKFFKPWGRKLNGTVYWQGEEPDDKGRIVITDNNVKAQVAVFSWSE